MLNALLYYAIYPVLLPPLLSIEKLPQVDAKTALALLRQVVKYIDDLPFLNAIMGPLMIQQIPKEYREIIERYPEDEDYYYEMYKKESLVGFSDKYENYLAGILLQ